MGRFFLTPNFPASLHSLGRKQPAVTVSDFLVWQPVAAAGKQLLFVKVENPVYVSWLILCSVKIDAHFTLIACKPASEN